ncbi:MAG: NAD(P)-binding protein [Sandaracinaceae bacterium]|nr:NAD(P)-binding protein [Myxococcales bacterium]MCB9658579.1 NAD(P)-binding protein [Sandaracinaceae bacterium]
MSSRRDVLRALLGAPLLGQALASGWLAGCGGEASSASRVARIEGELLGQDLTAGHRLRDGVSLAALGQAPTEHLRLAILGGGPAGLSAAYRASQSLSEGVALFELETVLGGTSRSAASDVTPYPWGAHYLPMPMAHNPDLLALLRDMGALEEDTPDGVPRGREELLVREPESRVFHQGYWERGLYPYAGASAEDLAELARFRQRVDELVRFRDAQGRRAFSIPLALSSRDEAITSLDRLSAAAWLEREGFRSARLRWLVDYACRDDYGLRAEQASAWAMLFYWVARTEEPGEDTVDLLTWPEGNGALVQHMAARAAQRGVRIERGQMALEVIPAGPDPGGPVRIAVQDVRSGALRRVTADRCIVAMPRFIAERVVRGLGERDRVASARFTYGAWMVANLHVRERPTSRGVGECWDNVLYDSPSLGYVSATHQRGRDQGQGVLTYYWPLATADADTGRQHLFDADYGTWRDAIVSDLRRAHRNLPDVLTRLDVFRWGHAMIQPRVGRLGADLRAGLTTALGGVHFAHSDLSGIAIFEEAFFHGTRAADEVVAALATQPAATAVEAG